MFMQMYASIRNEWWVRFRHQASFSFIPDACPGALNPGNVFIIMYNSCHPLIRPPPSKAAPIKSNPSYILR